MSKLKIRLLKNCPNFIWDCCFEFFDIPIVFESAIKVLVCSNCLEPLSDEYYSDYVAGSLADSIGGSNSMDEGVV